MRLRAGAVGVVLVVLACLDVGAPPARPVALSVVPVFDANGIFAANADRLRIRVFRIVEGPPRDSTAVKDTTVAIDATTGEASANLAVTMFESPQRFRVTLDAVRSSDNAVLFTGSQEVVVTSGSTGAAPQEVQVPVVYGGPSGARVQIAPKDTAMAAGTAFSYRATVFDANNVVVGVPVNFVLANSADASRLTLNRLTGLATAAAGSVGLVRVVAVTPSGLSDTARAFLGAVPSSVRITPGQVTLGTGQTVPLSAAVLDPIGNTLSLGSLTWASRSPLVATVDASSGVVTAVAPGNAVVVATFTTFSDSIVVAVPVAGNVVVTALGNGRSFRAPAVGDTVLVDVGADVRFTPDDKLGSYNARMTWNAAQLAFLSAAPAQTGDFQSPVVNSDSVAAGILRFAQADPAGAAGLMAVARFRFRAATAGSAGLALAVTEMSGPSPTFPNLRTRVTVVAGSVTVR